MIRFYFAISKQARVAMAELLIGTSGFSYEDWRVVFYPPTIRRIEMLDFYARVFPILEINATYHKTPGRKTAESMVRRAKSRLKFAIKAPGDLTHCGDRGNSVVLPFHRFLEPFEDDGCLSVVLFQFPNQFRRSPATWRYLDDVRKSFADVPIVVELRHSSWDVPLTTKRLKEWGISRAMVDQPTLRGLSQSGGLALTGPIAYFRLHGRNADDWYGGNERFGGRYRYRYSDSELHPWLSIVRCTGAKAESALVFFNNHPFGNAVINAVSFSAMLGQPLEIPDRGDLFV